MTACLLLTALLLTALLAAGPTDQTIARVSPSVVSLVATSSLQSMLESLTQELGEEVVFHVRDGAQQAGQRRIGSGIVVTTSTC